MRAHLLFAATAAIASAAPAAAQQMWYAYANADASAADINNSQSEYSVACSGVTPNNSICDRPINNGFTQLNYAHDESSGYARAEAAATGVYPFGNLGQTRFDAYGIAIADLTTGELHLSHTETFGHSTDYSGSNARADLYETITFQSNRTTPFDVGFHVHLDGMLGDGDQTLFSFYATDTYSSILSGDVGYRAPGGAYESVSQSMPLIFGQRGNWTSFGPEDYYRFFTVYPNFAQWIISESLFSQSGTSDFSNTASLSLDLPEGVTFTSASGLFLTAAAVPEPATWSLLIGGFGACGATLRQRRRLSPAFS